MTTLNGSFSPSSKPRRSGQRVRRGLGETVAVWLAAISIAASASAQGLEPELVPPAPPTPPAEELTLAGAEAIATWNSPNLRQAAAEVEAARGRAFQAGLYPNPTLTGGGMQLGGRDSQYYAQLSQELVVKDKLGLDQAAAHREVRQAQFRLQRARFDLATSVRQQFFTALAAQRRAEVLGQLKTLASRSQATALKLQKAGEAAEGDSLLLEVEFEKASLAAENTGALLDAARFQLAAAMGVPHERLGRVIGDLGAPVLDYADYVEKQGRLGNNALMQISRTELDRARILLRRAEVEPYPNVSVHAGYMREYVGSPHIGLLSLSMPLPVWNRNGGNIQAAQANIGRAAETIQRTENELSIQLAGAVGRFQASDQQVGRYTDRILPKARRSLDLTRNGFEQGQFDFLRLLQAQRALVEADLAMVAALEARWLAAAEIAGLLQLESFP